MDGKETMRPVQEEDTTTSSQASKRGYGPNPGRGRSLTESSGLSAPDSEFGVSERQLNEATAAASKVVTRKLSAGQHPSSEWQDADFGLGDEQIEALEAKISSGQQEAQVRTMKPPTQRQRSNSGQTLPGAPDPGTPLPALREVSEQESSDASFHVVRRDSSRVSSLLRFDSESLSSAARGAGSAPFESRVRGLACLGRARQCLNAFLGREEEGGYHRSP
eukprot:s1906_g8.t2